MKDSYLLELIKALTPTERREMALFLDSPYFNRGAQAKETARLFQFIQKAAPDFPEKLLKKDIAYAFVYPGQKVVSGKLEKLMTDLNKLLRAYALVSSHLAESREQPLQVEWAKWLRERGLLDRARQVLLKVRNPNEVPGAESLTQYRVQVDLVEEEHEWESMHNQVKGDLKIPELVLQLDLYYQNFRTELENRHLLQQKGAQLPEFEQLNHTIDFLEGKSLLLKISRNVNKILKSDPPMVEDFQQLMSLLQLNENRLSYQTFTEFYVYLRGACTLLINSGHLAFTPVLHQINKDNLGQGLFFVHGEISPHVYANIVQIALRAKDVVWAKSFTETYRHKLIGGDENHFFYQFNLSHCLFAEGLYDDAISMIPEASTHSHYHRTIRRLELKIYFEMRSELFAYKLDAFRKFVERTAPKNIPPTLRKMDLNFFNILNQFSKINKKNKAIADRLLARIEGKDLLSDRAWLIEKALEMR